MKDDKFIKVQCDGKDERFVYYYGQYGSEQAIKATADNPEIRKSYSDILIFMQDGVTTFNRSIAPVSLCSDILSLVAEL